MATQTQTKTNEQDQQPQAQAIVRGSQGQATPSRRGGYALGLPLTPIDFFRTNPFSLMRRMSEELGRNAGQAKWFDMSLKIEQLMIREKNINANVDFYSASAYYVLGIPVDLYPMIFAVSRISGWTAHVLEQYANNRLIRPLADYTGPTNQKYVPIDQR